MEIDESTKYSLDKQAVERNQARLAKHADEDVNKLETQHRNKMGKIAKRHQEEVQLLEDGYKVELENINKLHAHNIKKLRDGNTEKFEQEKLRLDSEFTSLQNRREQQLKIYRENMNEALKRMEEERIQLIDDQRKKMKDSKEISS